MGGGGRSRRSCALAAPRPGTHRRCAPGSDLRWTCSPDGSPTRSPPRTGSWARQLGCAGNPARRSSCSGHRPADAARCSVGTAPAPPGRGVHRRGRIRRASASIPARACAAGRGRSRPATSAFAPVFRRSARPGPPNRGTTGSGLREASRDAGDTEIRKMGQREEAARPAEPARKGMPALAVRGPPRTRPREMSEAPELRIQKAEGGRMTN